jgi:hypothetical protein
MCWKTISEFSLSAPDFDGGSAEDFNLSYLEWCASALCGVTHVQTVVNYWDLCIHRSRSFLQLHFCLFARVAQSVKRLEQVGFDSRRGYRLSSPQPQNMPFPYPETRLGCKEGLCHVSSITLLRGTGIVVCLDNTIDLSLEVSCFASKWACRLGLNGQISWHLVLAISGMLISS